MRKHLLIIQGPPDATRPYFCHALADAYAAAASEAGHGVERVEIARLEFPLLRSQTEWEGGVLPPALLPAQRAWRRSTRIWRRRRRRPSC